jgi:translocation and assembly module TamB
MAAQTPASAPPAAPPPRRRLSLTLVILAALLALLLAAGTAVTTWLWQSTHGLTLVIGALDRVLPARLTVTGATGSFADGFGFETLTYDAPTLTVQVERLQASLANLDLGLSLGALRFDFDSLSADRLSVRVRPSGRPSTGPPTTIASPVTVTAQRLAVGAFELVTGADPAPGRLEARAIETGIAIGPGGYDITDGRFAFGPAVAPLQAQLSGTLAGTTPFAVDARGLLAGSLRERPLQARVTAGGSLVDLQVAADVQPDPASAPPVPTVEPPTPAPGDKARAPAKPAAESPAAPRGRLQARIASFESPTLRALSADLDDIDPAAWVAGAPQARLAIQAELAPQPGPAFTLRGPVQVTNRLPGPIDLQRLPVRSAQATVQVDAQALNISDVVASLLRGTARGSFDIGFAQLDAWRAQASFNGVDPATIHTRMRSFSLDGQAKVAHAGGDTAVTGQLRNRAGVPLEATVDLRASAARVLLNTAVLRLGQGEARARGELQLTGTRAARLTGSVTQFDPSQLVAGIDARLTGTFDVDGALSPAPTGTVNFGVTDSQAFGRPLAGSGVLRLTPEQLLDVDAALSVRNATLTARGGLGGLDRSLVLDLSVPQLGDLGVPAAGRVTAQARLRGDWRAPAVEAQVSAAGLRQGDHSVAELQAVASYSGGTDGSWVCRRPPPITASGVARRLSMQTITLRADGRLSAHQIELSAANEYAQPVGALLVGGWQAAGAQADSPRRLARRTAACQRRPAARSRAAGTGTDHDRFSRWSVGPVAMRLAGGRFDETRLDLADGVLSTQGRFVDLRPTEFRGGDGALLAPAAAQGDTANGRMPITLRGNWQLRLGTQANGSVLIERTGGDIVAGTVPMGIRDLRLQAQVRANQLSVTGKLLGERAGRLDLQAAAELEGSGGAWRLAQQRPLAATIDADLPSIAWVNTLLSDAVRTNVRLGGSAAAQLRIDGTPAAPNAQGTIGGKDLRVAWIEQGIRLEGGTLKARIEGSEIILDELRFSGPPQVVPSDRRALLAMAREDSTEHLLAISGRLQLRDLAGVLQVQAVRVPFLQRPDRWVIATGGANIVFDQRQVQVNGGAIVNAGFVDFSRTDLPSLSGDVQVRRAASPAPSARDAPIGVNFDIGIDLGPAFYLRGAGLDTRVEGQVRLRAEGRGAIRATGAVEAKGGVYEGFGQKLAIERGRVNFQGPLANPGLDVLALRRGLPVDVGVSITRTAANPLIKLYSSDAMPDLQILSWLVLGRPAEEGGQDRAALATAAAGLLSGTGEGLPTQLARRLGIDEISLRSGDTGGVGSLLPRSTVAGNVRGNGSGNLAGEIVTIGKRLSDDITISYEQAISSAGSVVQVSYQLTRRLSVLARAGTENALDLVYTFAFD